ncbi:cytochrome o ubiquinol oxidase subunit IV [Kyrpidia spormannii]|uniref:Cytochrome aa3-600 quinol oxidase (Subunit IV) n=2 Tax=Kyrpidia spormannii TaxID=2055160 RepID=A0ACA8Z9X7_9BACL|nr:cytochrome C oxidase subunit IV family protein [Kyrpidia spormannii]CAB3393151.1 cytochrome aa3-600 quinol oxidase (subunit IV) [Kyrpidia spormannii]CAB3394070.1 Cytochrome C oxidase subunit IV [Kyrpidia spormannii]
MATNETGAASGSGAAPRHAHSGDGHSAGKYVLGYVASLVLTAIAFGLAFTHTLTASPLVLVLLVLAGCQILVQLFFFMHVTEGNGPAFHSVAILLGFVFTFAVVLMSMWIMTFSSQVA